MTHTHTHTHTKRKGEGRGERSQTHTLPLSHTHSGSDGEIPLIFTFYAEEEDDGGEPDPGAPVVEVVFDIAEIERVVEEDIILVAKDLGLDVTIEEFFRFGMNTHTHTHTHTYTHTCPCLQLDGCPTEIITFNNLTFNWREAAIGVINTLSCPCPAADLQRTATRQCGGNFITGAVWYSAMDIECEFEPLTVKLCQGPEVQGHTHTMYPTYYVLYIHYIQSIDYTYYIHVCHCCTCICMIVCVSASF